MIERLTGTDVAEPFRRHCKTELAAVRFLRRKGGIAYLAHEVLPARGAKVIPVAMAQRGDIMIADTELGEAAGVCLGRVAAFPGKNGLVFLNFLNCKSAWTY